MLWYKVARVQHLAWYPTPRADKGQIPAAVLPSPLQCPSSSGPCRFSCQGQDAHRELLADGLRDRGHQLGGIDGMHHLQPANPRRHGRPQLLPLRGGEPEQADRLLDLASEEDAAVLEQRSTATDLRAPHHLAAAEQDLVLGGAVEAGG